MEAASFALATQGTAGDSGDEGPGVRLTAKTFGVGQRDMASGKLDKLSPSGLDAASSEGV